MKNLHKTLLTLVAGAFITTGANAAVNYDNGMNAEPYIGAKIGQYDVDDADDAALSYGIYGGAKFTPNFGIEAEYLATSEEDFYNEGTEKLEYEGELYGLYGTFDYYFPNTNGLYAKGRLGVANNEIEGKYTDSAYPEDDEDIEVDEADIAGGIGLGYDFSPNTAVELAYDWYPSVEDVDVSGVTLGAKFKF